MRVLGAMLAATVLLALAGEGASAAVETHGGYKYVTKSFKLRPGAARTFKAECPKRTHVLGGGHYNSGGYGDVVGVHSYPYDSGDRRRVPDDGWAAQLRGFGKAHPALVYAVCSRLFPEYVTRNATIPATGEGQNVEVFCDPPSLSSVSGGTRGASTVRQVRAIPFNTNSWETGVANHGAETKSVKFFAVCANLTKVVAQSGDVSAPGRTQSNASAQCPPHAPHVVGGGLIAAVSGQAAGNIAIAATHPLDPGTVGPFGAWRAWIDNYNASALNLRAVATCLPRR